MARVSRQDTLRGSANLNWRLVRPAAPASMRLLQARPGSGQYATAWNTRSTRSMPSPTVAFTATRRRSSSAMPGSRSMSCRRSRPENNLAETAFVVSSSGARFGIRWFTPTVEIDLCGHATLASAHVLYEPRIHRARPDRVQLRRRNAHSRARRQAPRTRFSVTAADANAGSKGNRSRSRRAAHGNPQCQRDDRRLCDAAGHSGAAVPT